ncbi:ATP-grasp domain-containing protein [Nocardia iowensis]|uniref:ATP-grasp domain-containing protein n=1 Tax=Nocardia iowensis TaxID=204891 RepID=A0ABX8S281_NOCIO|nr:hypothetical protein [Nocardia iowensis]QXN94715.1 hypothetical protein KV110_17675 [Nocardia iowensis]
MKPHVTVLHRAPAIAMPFADRIDHDHYAVSYVTRKASMLTVPEGAAEVVVLDDFAAAPGAIRELANRFGIPERIVARSEHDLLTAADLRVEFGIQGNYPEHVLPFRDKLVMCEAISGAGIPIPEFACAADRAAVESFAAVHGFPLIIKPTLGAGARGIVQLNAPNDLAELPDLDSQPYLVQHFCPDDVGHVDGVWLGTELGPWRASRYLNTCLDFAAGGTRLGSVEIDDRDLVLRLGAFTESVCMTLSKGRPQVFHLEFFLGSEQDGTPRIQFLEIAARVGGAEIAYIWRDVHGYDLLGASLDIQLGRDPAAAPLGDEIGGWLVIRPSVPIPCRVLGTHLSLRPTEWSAPYGGDIPEPGSVISETAGYINVGATLRFLGTSSADVMASIQHTAAEFRMHCAPVESAAS